MNVIVDDNCNLNTSMSAKMYIFSPECATHKVLLAGQETILLVKLILVQVN